MDSCPTSVCGADSFPQSTIPGVCPVLFLYMLYDSRSAWPHTSVWSRKTDATDLVLEYDPAAANS